MPWMDALSYIILSLLFIQKSNGISSPIQPYTNYQHSLELQPQVAHLWWTVDEAQQEVTFELHVRTTGWIALGIAPVGDTKTADIGLGWIERGQVYFQDRYEYDKWLIIDNTTTDWFSIAGREESGWTAVQFRRSLDTYDMLDVPLQSDPNAIFFAYGLQDPDMSQSAGFIYNYNDRIGSRILSFGISGNPSSEANFAGLEYFDFRLNQRAVPSTNTNLHCKIYKTPSNLKERRHIVGYKAILEPNNRDLIHHLMVYECVPTAMFDDNNLPEGSCYEIAHKTAACMANIMTGWTVGDQEAVRYPDTIGYPVGGDFEIKYYMLEIHYENPRLMPNHRDSSGFRFYLGNKRNRHEFGYLAFGTDSSPAAIAIPPGAQQFMVDSYCPAEVTKNFPQSGLTLLATFPHVHYQGRRVWTKIIRNNRVIEYLFNDATYGTNYQSTDLSYKTIQIYPGDELATRCVYTTTDRYEIVLGGNSATNEMCQHVFAYYPRMKNFYGCMTTISGDGWGNIIRTWPSTSNFVELTQWLKEIRWTPQSISQWQKLLHDAPRLVAYGPAENYTYTYLPKIPTYTDLTSPI